MIRVGRVTGAFGVRGAVKVRSLTDFDDRFDTGSELYLAGVRRHVEWRRRGGGTLVVKLSGIDDRDAAERERWTYLEVPDEAARPLEGPAWYVDQLLGLRVLTEAGRDLGRLEEVWERPANDVWVAREDGPRGTETLLPATREAVLEVDLETRHVVVADWLLGLEEA